VDYEDEFSAFAEERWPTLVRAAVFLGAAPHEAEDLAQTTLVLCYRKWERVRDAEDRDAYVYRILLNSLRDTRRSAWWRRRDARSLPDQAVADTSDATAIADAVHRAMSTLTTDQQQVVVLRYFVQLTEAQTAAVLGIPAGTVKSRLSRSIAALSANDHLAEFSGGTR